MSSNPKQPEAKHPEATSEDATRRALVEELEQRIEAIEALDDATIGQFTGWDWFVCVIGAIVLPALAMWWFAG